MHVNNTSFNLLDSKSLNMGGCSLGLIHLLSENDVGDVAEEDEEEEEGMEQCVS